MLYRKLIKNYPKLMFMLVSKLVWIIGFFFTLYIIQDHAPTLKQFILASVYTIITLPVSYHLTYQFGDNSK